MKTFKKIAIGSIAFLALSPLSASALAVCKPIVSSPRNDGRGQAQVALSAFMSNLRK